jgi:adenylate cyclase
MEFSYDLPFNLHPLVRANEVVLVYMDDVSHKELGQAYDQPWDRSLHARLLDRLKASQARAVVFDILFSESDAAPAKDQELARAMSSFGKVVVGVDTTLVERSGAAPFEQILYPDKDLEKAVAGQGLVALPQSPDFVIRQHAPERNDLAESIPTLAWSAAQVVGAKVVNDAKARRQPRWLNYYGPPGWLPNVSYSQALDPAGTPAGFFSNKVVFVGAQQTADFTGKGKDEYRTPYLWQAAWAPGVEVHAYMFLNLLRRDWLTRLPTPWELLLLGALGALAGISLARFQPIRAVLLALGAMALVVITAILASWQAQIWFAWIIAVIQFAVAGSWSVVFNSIRLHYEKLLAEEEKKRLAAESKLLEEQKRLLSESLEKHLSHALAQEVIKRPELLKPETRPRPISILFSDIEGYSKLSAMKNDEDLAKALNRYYESALACVHETGGTVVKLMGDAIFAIWNAPLDQANHQEHACRAAWLLQERLDRFDAEERDLSMRTRIGVHCGEAQVGNIGSSSRFDFTAIGHNVNLAARLEGLNKYLGTQLLITAEISAP